MTLDAGKRKNACGDGPWRERQQSGHNHILLRQHRVAERLVERTRQSVIIAISARAVHAGINGIADQSHRPIAEGHVAAGGMRAAEAAMGLAAGIPQRKKSLAGISSQSVYRATRTVLPRSSPDCPSCRTRNEVTAAPYDRRH